MCGAAYMKEMNLRTLMQGIVQRCNKSLARTGSSIQLSLPLSVSTFYWHDRSLEKLLRQLTSMASLAVDPGNPIHIAVSQKKKMRGLETFFRIQPSHWVQMRIAQRGRAGFEEDARWLMSNLGYHCEEWIGANGTWPQMGAYSTGRKRLLKLVLVIQWQKNTQLFELLIPVAQSRHLPDSCKRDIPSNARNSSEQKLGMRFTDPQRVRRTKGSRMSEACSHAGVAVSPA
jgi:hypothetical protein